MKPLFVLLITSLIALFVFRALGNGYDFPRAARVGMAVMLMFTALGHVLYTEGMAMMIPAQIPYKKELVYFTGLVEVLGAIGLLFPQYRTLTAWLLILFFLLMVPANIKAAVEGLNYQTGTFDGPGLRYLWFRVPLQALFIGWVYLSAIRFA